MATVKRENPTGFNVLLERLKELQGKQVQAGWFSSSKYENGPPVAQVAQWQELGVPSRSIPPHPFMRPAIAAKTPQWKEIAEKGSKAILKGTRTLTDVMDLIGQSAEDGIREAIIDVTTPPLSPITLELRAMKRQGIKITGATVGEAARKVHEDGYQTPDVSSKPLVDEGIMIDTATHIVEDAR